MAQERIQKVLAEQGLCSRRAAEQIIREGRVKVNGHPVTLGDKMDPHQDILSVDGQRIYIQRKREFYYYMLNLSLIHISPLFTNKPSPACST